LRIGSLVRCCVAHLPTRHCSSRFVCSVIFGVITGACIDLQQGRSQGVSPHHHPYSPVKYMTKTTNAIYNIHIAHQTAIKLLQ